RFIQVGDLGVHMRAERLMRKPSHVEARKKLIEENRLDAVVTVPAGVFRPYAGVSTAILFFTKGAKTDRVWFYDMEHDGFSLDDKRNPVPENDIPDVLACWHNRN